MRAQPNTTEMQRCCELLYPEVEDGWLVLSHPAPMRLMRQGKPVLVPHWFDLNKVTYQKITQAGQRFAPQHNVYFSVVLHSLPAQLQLAYLAVLVDDSPPPAGMAKAAMRIDARASGEMA